MSDQMDGSRSRRKRYAAGGTLTAPACHATLLTVLSRPGDSHAHQPGGTSLGGSLHRERLNVRFRAWRRAFVIFGVITGILVAVLIGLFLTLGGAGSHAPGPAMPLSGAAPASSPGTASPVSGTASPGTAPPSSGAVAAPSSQAADTLAVAGLIIGCVSAIGTLFSGWGTLVTARAMARQDLAPRAPRTRARSTRSRNRKMK